MQSSSIREIKTVNCPYNPAHIMPESSLLNHLSRCSAPNKHLFTKCKYNPIHVYPNELIQNHYKQCKSKAQFEKNNKKAQSSDEWDVQEDTKNEKPQKIISSTIRNPANTNRRNNNNANNSQMSIQQSTIKEKSNKFQAQLSQDYIEIISDEDDFSAVKEKMQNMSMRSNNSKKSKQPQSSFKSYSVMDVQKSSVLNQSNLRSQSSQSQINRSISKKGGNVSGQNESRKIEEQKSKAQQKSLASKNSNETLKSIYSVQKSRDNSSNLNQSNALSSRQDEDEDFEVEDF